MPTSPFGISMDRMGSGTTWIPDAVRVPSRHTMLGSWDAMLHGFVFVQYDKQGGPRGDDQFGSLNWAMFMLGHSFGGGRVQLRTMLSLDPATVSSRGYPLLLQSGETYDGEPVFDRQHPHDFFMELGVLYERPLVGPVGFSLYAAPAGEPALGPVAFMHRPSAMDLPAAGLGHHWQDATHIAFGVLTAGLFGRNWKVEASAFNGREPNEKRWDFDRLRLDSYSGRLTVNPTANLSATLGYGYLESPESLSPDESMRRVTASLMHGRKLGANGQWASTAVFGANRHEGEDSFSKSYLIESEAVLDSRNTIMSRVEHLRKTAHDLRLDTPDFGFESHHAFGVSAFTLGYIREFATMRGWTFGIGGHGTLNLVGTDLARVYGSRTPLGAMLYLRVRPALAGAMNHAGMHH
jgi:hypothetical protein